MCGCAWYVLYACIITTLDVVEAKVQLLVRYVLK